MKYFTARLHVYVLP